MVHTVDPAPLCKAVTFPRNIISNPTTHLMSWTITNDMPSQCIFTRPLDTLEVCFFYAGKRDGVTDLVENYLAVTSEESLFLPESVSRAWVAAK